MAHRANNKQRAKRARQSGVGRNGGIIPPRQFKHASQSKSTAIRREPRFNKTGPPIHSIRPPPFANQKTKLKAPPQQFAIFKDFAPFASAPSTGPERLEK